MQLLRFFGCMRRAADYFRCDGKDAFIGRVLDNDYWGHAGIAPDRKTNIDRGRMEFLVTRHQLVQIRMARQSKSDGANEDMRPCQSAAGSFRLLENLRAYTHIHVN